MFWAISRCCNFFQNLGLRPNISRLIVFASVVGATTAVGVVVGVASVVALVVGSCWFLLLLLLLWLLLLVVLLQLPLLLLPPLRCGCCNGDGATGPGSAGNDLQEVQGYVQKP